MCYGQSVAGAVLLSLSGRHTTILIFLCNKYSAFLFERRTCPAALTGPQGMLPVLDAASLLSDYSLPLDPNIDALPVELEPNAGIGS